MPGVGRKILIRLKSLFNRRSPRTFLAREGSLEYFATKVPLVILAVMSTERRIDWESRGNWGEEVKRL